MKNPGYTINKLVWSLLLFLTCILQACVTVGTQVEQWKTYNGQPIAFSASGRLSIKNQSRGLHTNFDWNSKNHQLHLITISSPVGNVLGELCKDRTGVLLRTADGKTFSGQTAIELSESLLGYSVPVDDLDLWINGYLSNQTPYQIKNNYLQQNGWLIERVVDTNQLPKKLILTNSQFTILLIFDYFQSNPQEEKVPTDCHNKTTT
ncbi:MAG: outer membrane lipoprotein LolB [Neisseriaceae bacterium]